MNAHPWSDRLSEHLDGTLAADEAALLERHLAACAECRTALAELGAVRAWLRTDVVSTADEPTQGELVAIQRRIATEGGMPVPPIISIPQHRRRWTARGASGALLLAAGIAAVLLVRADRSSVVPAVLPSARVAAAPAPYADASRELEAVLRANRGELRPQTARALEATLASIDAAIAQAQRARAADPGNDFVARHLDRLRGERLATLRDAVAAARS